MLELCESFVFYSCKIAAFSICWKSGDFKDSYILTFLLSENRIFLGGVQKPSQRERNVKIQ